MAPLRMVNWPHMVLHAVLVRQLKPDQLIVIFSPPLELLPCMYIWKLRLSKNNLYIHWFKIWEFENTFFPVSVWTSVGTISMKYWKFIKSAKAGVNHLISSRIYSLISVSFSSPSRGWIIPAWSSPKLSFSILWSCGKFQFEHNSKCFNN